jgi:hypothetical protein
MIDIRPILNLVDTTYKMRKNVMMRCVDFIVPYSVEDAEKFIEKASSPTTIQSNKGVCSGGAFERQMIRENILNRYSVVRPVFVIIDLPPDSTEVQFKKEKIRDIHIPVLGLAKSINNVTCEAEDSEMITRMGQVKCIPSGEFVATVSFDAISPIFVWLEERNNA